MLAYGLLLSNWNLVYSQSIKEKANLTYPNGFVLSSGQINKKTVKNLFWFSLYYSAFLKVISES